MSRQAVVHAYRHLLRQSLRAIQFSKPARYTLLKRLRLAFRRGDAADFDQQKINNTLEFLRYATVENGLEHRIVKNLLFVWWNEAQGIHKRVPKKPISPQETEINITAYDAFSHNIQMLNESMGMCLPSMIIRGRS